jgi:ADP-ribose pyrophosphatase YjhB (NUDIX family)
MTGGNARGLVWMAPEEALARSGEFRTADTAALLLKTFQDYRPGLDMVRGTYDRMSSAETDEVSQLVVGTEDALIKSPSIVSSVVRRAAGMSEPMYLLAVAGRGKGKDLLTLVGGKIDMGEGIREANIREVFEESGINRGKVAGCSGIYLNYRGEDEVGIRRFVSNFAHVVVYESRDVSVPEQAKDEIAELKWMDAKEIALTPDEEFRTADTKESILTADERLRRGDGLMSPGFVELVQVE